MGNKDSAPDKVSHDSGGVVPGTGDMGGEIHKTTIEKGDNKYTGYGPNEDAANRAAGENYNKGKADK